MPTLWHDELFNGVIGSILACPKFTGNGLNLRVVGCSHRLVCWRVAHFDCWHAPGALKQ